MFDEPPSLPMRAAIASLLGSLFGVAMILFTEGVHAQTQAAEPYALLPRAESQILRLGEAALHALRASEPVYGLGNGGARSLHLSDSVAEAASGLRWQVARTQGLRSEGIVPRSNDLVSVGLQIRF